MDDLIERLRAEAEGPHDPKFVTGELLRSSADRIAALEAGIEHWKKLHAENCAAYDDAVAGREYFRQQVRATDALEADKARLIEALTPFAKSGDLLVQADDRGDFWAYRPAGGDEYGITGKHLLAARATLAEIKEAPDA